MRKRSRGARDILADLFDRVIGVFGVLEERNDGGRRRTHDE